MTAMLIAGGLAVSLGGPLALLLATRKFRFNSLSLPGRLSLWLLAFIALTLAAYGAGSAWLTRIGVQPFGWFDLLGAAVVVIASLAGAICFQLLQRKRGIKNTEGAKLQQKIYDLSARYRFFVVVTAAVVEEVLYRGYAIGIGQEAWGSLAIAFVVSLFVFVVVHFSHGVIQLITVCWIALLISLLFVLTNNLFACMLAHFVVDAVGVLVTPWAASRQRAQRVSLVQEG
jgi:membrane protease YdiL (CAAX protease family)